jgi:hypothetical protein
MSAGMAEAAERVERRGETQQQHQQTFDFFTSQGFVPTYVSGHCQNGVIRLDTVYERGSVTCSWQMRNGLNDNDFRSTDQNMTDAGYRRVSYCRYWSGSGFFNAAIWFLEQN